MHEAEADASSTEFFPRLQDNIAVLREAHRYIGLQARTLDIDPAGEWLLDNFHVVVAQIKEIHDGLPRRYFRDLAGVARRAPRRIAARLWGRVGVRRAHR